LAQLIGVVILIVIGKVILDLVKDQLGSKNNTKAKKSGEVIDLSEAWINPSALPYQLKERPWSNRELAVYDMIYDLLKTTSYSVSVKMPMAEVFTLPMQTENSREYLNRIKERTFDLIIMERPGLKPVLVVNVESQNDQRKKQISDQFRDNALAGAGLASITIDPNANWNDDILIQKLRSAGLKL